MKTGEEGYKSFNFVFFVHGSLLSTKAIKSIAIIRQRTDYSILWLIIVVFCLLYYRKYKPCVSFILCSRTSSSELFLSQ